MQQGGPQAYRTVALTGENIGAVDARYPALRLARAVMQTRGLAGAAFNAAKELALDLFIAGRIGFLDMGALVEDTLITLSGGLSLGNAMLALEDVQRADHLARIRAQEAALRRQKGH